MKNNLRKLEEKIIQFLSRYFLLKSESEKVIEGLRAQIKDLEEKWEHIPKYICFICRQGIWDGSGYINYLGKYFHNEGCFKEYCRVIEKPNRDYKYIDNKPVKYYNE